jgi:hypothetical protein
MILVCINPSDRLTKGKKYEAEPFISEHSYNLLKVKDDTGEFYMYSINRFITVEEWKNKLRKMLDKKKIC